MMGDLETSLMNHTQVWRGAIFFGLLALLAGLELAWPRRQASDRISGQFSGAAKHWAVNLLFGTINIILLRLVIPGGLVAIALTNQGGGLIGWLNPPAWIGILVCLVLLDFTVYAQHVALHKVPVLWPLHIPHHNERTLNASSGLRFHPGEAVLSAIVKGIAVYLSGAPAIAVILFEILLTSASLFTHANWSLGRIDKWLQALIVTPDMHRLHHARDGELSPKNFGFFLSAWDHLLGSYLTRSAAHHQMLLGLTDMPDEGLQASMLYPLSAYVAAIRKRIAK